jgi:hypothetical protein
VIALQVCVIVIVGAVASFGVAAVAQYPLIASRRRRPRAAAPPPPSGLAWCERLVSGAWMAGELHRGLRPAVIEIAVVRLRAAGIRLDEDGDAARARLGEELWELVRPDRPPPEDRLGPGLKPGAVSRLLARLEQL